MATERLYKNISDSKMLEEAQTICDLFDDDVADFTAKDPALDAAYVTAFQAAIDLAIDTPTDNTVVNNIESLTDTLYDRWKDCKEHYQDATYYIDLAFPGDIGAAKAYGSDDYRAMSQNLDKVLMFMDQFHDQAVTDNALLNAKGYSDASIAAIETKGNAFRAALRAQNKAQKARLKTTQNRIDILNAVWLIVQRINRASKVVYRGDYAKIQQYLMPAPGTNEARENLSATGQITKSTNGAPVNGATLTLTNISVEARSDEQGNYAFGAGIPNGNQPVLITCPGFVDLNDSITFVNGTLVQKDFVLTPV